MHSSVGDAVCSLGMCMLLACGPQRYAVRSPFEPDARAWAAAHAGAPQASALIDDARVLALGEAAHGARDVFLARAELTQQLIEAGWARALVLEASAWDTCPLDRWVRRQGGDLHRALAELPGLYGHDDSAAFFRWLRGHNAGKREAEQVGIFGMDAQSASACGAIDTSSCPGRATRCAQAQALERAPNLGETYFGRDEIMAGNVLEIAAATAGGVIVWVHAGHASRSAPLLFNDRWSQTAPMGWFLARALGPAYRPMTVTFREGTVAVQALRGGLIWPHFGEFTTVRLEAVPEATLEGLVKTSEQPVLLDLRALPPLEPSTAWFATPRFTRSLGAAEHPKMVERSTVMRGWARYVLREAFDFVLVLPTTRPLDLWLATPRKPKENSK